ncbi:[2Fe-2S] binding domain protein [Burkholderia ambifaria AMMD]|uniref:Xanthine dehydrogenase, molybdenum binding subunit apoprotein n=1 Tax=Burkholderia ambifaria (strain ATCC BAA-244 / DSM 16087 / CCUG 44356 / LMG 19182 / AMMD) TaxID=339670 RepID=Q0B3H5_BURCM|nr:molybdopterin cofactor-binding domain-containing protein [Burkholderia ambifaria]ABI91298.1 xanthine dehydrogenase, molybdenum binding subunit apoprotein [Burkholderia ambifaria AMMD]AJY26194.1 [2Fe-2S] binding domain protein [Burkholderia ambifaria AMMD]MBR7932121.1 molybdopterin-dependent oxidoreductase [Burkholderia ambifaria]PEH69894.1 aldehyde oxidase [Burkholderia ambifaria]QQC08949.1 molybdopterin-dependent oxidoreductase [Burkholderia ambifaria]
MAHPLPDQLADVRETIAGGSTPVSPEPDWFELNGTRRSLPADHSQRLIDHLRADLRQFGTKEGCRQGDCGSCTVIVDGDARYACLIPVGQVAGRRVVTVEGLAEGTRCGGRLQHAFLAHQAVQCGFCTPGMLTAAAAAIDAGEVSDRASARAAIDGVLCRCTGYQKIVDAVTEAGCGAAARCVTPPPSDGPSVGVPLTRLDGPEKVDGSQRFGADGYPADSLFLRAVRNPHHRTRFVFGDLDAFVRAHPGVHRVLTHADVPGMNLHGVATPYMDQPVLPETEARHHLEAVALVVGERGAIAALDLDCFPVNWEPLTPVLAIADAVLDDSPLLHADRPGNVLIEGHVRRGDPERAMQRARHVVSATFESSFVEHAYLEPEAGWARRVGDTIEIHSSTQAPHPHRADLARILAVAPEQVRVVATAVGGGFGGKLDMTVQPLLAIAAWHLDRPVAMVLSREESMATSTKRHPGRMTSSMAADADGRLHAVTFDGDFNTGAFASWGTAVANRVPVHAGGPYVIPHYAARARAIHTHVTAAGAFRGFGVPQTTMSQEQLIDELAFTAGIDPLEFRAMNALRPGDTLPTGQVLDDSVGLVACLDALRPAWRDAHARVATLNAAAPGHLRHGVGMAAFFYGCGNTALPNPSTVRFGIRPDGTIVLHQGAVDAGQGANTVIPQIAADALGVPVDRLHFVGPDTSVTPDCGRTSASRQTFITGRAAFLAGTTLRHRLLAFAGASSDARISADARGVAVDGKVLDLRALPVDAHGYVIAAEESFDPPTTSLDASGQGSPYATYAFGAQMAEVAVDCDSGRVRVLKVVAAHDVGKMVNPTLLEGQIEGAVAQGIGMALMEKYHPGRYNNLHDYLIPTVHDMPDVQSIFIEAPTAVGPYGAKGIGEPALVPTAAAILNAIHHATGVRIREAPATPDVVRVALAARKAPSTRR